MSPPPDRPKIYHIIHVDRLASVVGDGHLWCDAEIVRRGTGGTIIGMSKIKQRRLSLPVTCHPGDRVGDYVPFYFCPRSLMLYLIYKANHPDLAYQGGQEPIVHLEADLNAVVGWAGAQGHRWAFSLSNAAAHYTQFRSSLDDLEEVDWAAVAATDFRSDQVQEGKQAEFLVHHSFPWSLVERLGVYSPAVAERVQAVIAGAAYQPTVDVRRDWYY